MMDTVYSAKAINMMKKMGYEEGKGLGKDLQGPAETLNLQSNTKNTGLAYQAPQKHGLYSCRGCNKVFNHVSQVSSHINTKQHLKQRNSISAPMDFECLFCNIQLRDLQEVIGHDLSVQHTKMNNSSNSFKCEICGVAANSQSQWNQHLNGTQHLDQLKKNQEMGYFNFSDNDSSLESSSQESTSSSSEFREEGSHLGLGSGDTDEYDQATKRLKLSETTTEEPTSSPSNIINYPALNSLYYSPTPLSLSSSKFNCTLCNVPCNSQAQLQAHLNSKGHLTKVTPSQNVHHCAVCNQTFNSSAQLHAHLNGRKHQDQAMRANLQVDLMQDRPDLIQNRPDLIQNRPELNCQLCGLVFNSVSQKLAHDSGRAHLTRQQAYIYPPFGQY